MTEIDSSLRRVYCRNKETCYSLQKKPQKTQILLRGVAGVFWALQSQQPEQKSRQISPTHILLLLPFPFICYSTAGDLQETECAGGAGQHSVPGTQLYHNMVLLQISPGCLKSEPPDFKALLRTFLHSPKSTAKLPKCPNVQIFFLLFKNLVNVSQQEKNNNKTIVLVELYLTSLKTW